MIRIVKHVIVETTEERDRQVEQVEAAIRTRFPEATTEVVQGLLDEDRVVEARLPLHQLAAWRAQRSQLLAQTPDPQPGPARPVDPEPEP
ncbi:hypothetical protein [Methylobacterium radiodurans]|uniref:Uncharacterized protein n=1 Tax=Methylobacterium radiodurans TaxID=2202828 RepID=A0A2U8VR32_9HYPH|nr:hypothetical protein [Methylobacterium radiodurans]AWN35938.1 hypothetical protein DK427_09495 [Methylobacterium radiodurans]